MFQAQIGLIRKLRVSAVLAGIFLFLIFGLAIFPVASSVDDTQAESRQSETTLTVSTEDLDLAFEINAVNGSFAEASANVSVTTNNYTGYTLNIITGNTGTDAGKLVGEHSSFNTISSATASADFAADAATEMNGLWGYKPSKVNGEANTSYLPAPTELTTIEQTDAANANANTYTIGLGARADLSYEAGAYVNTFVITSVANPVGYTITYDKNTEDEVTNMPEDQGGSTSGTTITLADDVPVRVDYDFMGWCDGTPNGANCTGTIYQAGDDYDIDQTTGNLKTLYALWGRHVVTFDDAYAAAGKSKDTTSGKYQLQEMTPAICSAVTTGQTGQLVDIRDSKRYTVSKENDGRCWMTQNLSLGLSTSKTLTHADTDVGWTSADATATWTPTGNTSTSAGTVNVHNQTVPYVDWTGTNTAPDSAYYSGYYYYDWTAAIASNDSSWITDQYAVAPDSICPAGWRLPKGVSGESQTEEDASEWNKLLVAQGVIDGWAKTNDSFNHDGVNITFGGSVFEGDIYPPKWIIWGIGSNGYYWTSSSTGSGAYQLRVYSSTVGPASKSDSIYGYSIRCLARDGNEPIVTTSFDEAYARANKTKDTTSDKYKLSDMSTSICSAVTAGQTGQLVDIRDGTVYNVGKLADGRCWTLDNLALDVTSSTVQANLSPDNTNATQAAITNYKNGGNPDNIDGWATQAVAYESNTTVWDQPRINIDSKDLTRGDLTNPSDPLTDADSWKFGIYYNYCASSVGTYCYNYGYIVDRNPNSAIDSEYDICPANWRMPTGGAISSTGTDAGGGEYQALYNAYPAISGGDDQYTRFRKALHLPLPGGFESGVAYSQGSTGTFLSSTYYNNTSVSALMVRTIPAISVYPQNGAGPGYGYSVRCIAK